MLPSTVREKASGNMILCGLFALSLVLNVWLGLRTFQSTPRPDHAFRPLAAGDQLPSLKVDSLQGKSSQLVWAGSKPTVLYVFSPQCGWCKRNLANMVALAAQTSADYRFVGLSLSDTGLSKYVLDNGLTFPIYQHLDKNLASKVGIRTTPHTILISPEGKVLKAWTGAYGSRLQKEIQDTFRVHLPGMAESSSSTP